MDNSATALEVTLRKVAMAAYDIINETPSGAQYENIWTRHYFKIDVDLDVVWCYCTDEWVEVPLTVEHLKNNEMIIEIWKEDNLC